VADFASANSAPLALLSIVIRALDEEGSITSAVAVSASRTDDN